MNEFVQNHAVFLVVMLWITGGFGWMYAYENAEKKHKPMLFMRVIIIAIWPLFLVASAIHSIYASLRTVKS